MTALQTATAKVVRRLLPFLVVCYFVAYLDRANVGFAALTMNADLGIGPEAYGFIAGIFFAGVAFETLPRTPAAPKVVVLSIPFEFRGVPCHCVYFSRFSWGLLCSRAPLAGC